MGGGSQNPRTMEAPQKNPVLPGSRDDEMADMDSTTVPGGDSKPLSAKQVVNVLVTGFGPFPNREGTRYEGNASHLITRLLPSFLSPSSPLNPSNVQINILNPTAGDGAYVRTEYAYVRKFVKELHAKYADKVDLIMHIGMANGWHHVTVERGAFQQGMSSSWWGDLAREEYYLKADDAGQTIKDLESNPWTDVPIGLGTSLNAEIVAEKAMWLQATAAKAAGVSVEIPVLGAELADSVVLPIKLHDEAGPYLCGFIYYESMATCFVERRRADVIFCHVPGETDDESLRKGKNAIVAVIGAAVGELLKREEEALDT